MPSTNCTARFFSLALPSRVPVVIVVQGVAGGKWEFPLTLVGSEPQVDDVIAVDTARLGETAAVGFRLTSTTRWAQARRFCASCSRWHQKRLEKLGTKSCFPHVIFVW